MGSFATKNQCLTLAFLMTIPLPSFAVRGAYSIGMNTTTVVYEGTLTDRSPVHSHHMCTPDGVIRAEAIADKSPSLSLGVNYTTETSLENVNVGPLAKAVSLEMATVANSHAPDYSAVSNCYTLQFTDDRAYSGGKVGRVPFKLSISYPTPVFSNISTEGNTISTVSGAWKKALKSDYYPQVQTFLIDASKDGALDLELTADNELHNASIFVETASGLKFLGQSSGDYHGFTFIKSLPVSAGSYKIHVSSMYEGTFKLKISTP